MSKFMFDFVKSLSMREKAYFKRYSEIYGGDKNKNYLRLYSYFDKIELYDPKAISEHFKNEKMGKYLSSEENYLLDQLLKSLVNYHFDNGQKNKLLKEAHFIRILFEKGFSEKAYKLLIKVKKSAYHYEDFSLVLSLIELEEEILFYEGIFGFTIKLLDLQKEREKISEKIINLNSFRILREQIRDLQFTVGYINDTSKFPEIYQHPLLSSDKMALSLRAKEHWYYIKDFSFYLTRCYTESLRISEQYLKFVEEHIYLFKNAKLLPLLSNYMHNCSLVGDRTTFYKILNKLELLAEDSNLDQSYIKYIIYVRQLDFLFKIKDLNETKKIIIAVTAFASEKIDDLSNYQANYLLRLIVRTYILTKDFRTALQWLNRISGKINVEYMLEVTRVFYLITYFDLKWFDKLENELESASKVLKSHKKSGPFSSAFIQFFNVYLRSPEKRYDELNSLIGKMKQIEKNEELNFPFEQFDFIQWCEDHRINEDI